MTADRFDKCMSTISAVWFGAVVLGPLVVLWGPTSWAQYGRVALTVSILWLLLAIVFGSLAHRYAKNHRRVPVRRFP